MFIVKVLKVSKPVAIVILRLDILRAVTRAVQIDIKLFLEVFTKGSTMVTILDFSVKIKRQSLA